MEGVYDNLHSHDLALVADAQTGSVRAFELLFERYQAPLLRYLTRATGDPELAADLAQETFLDAFRDLDRFADDRPFAAWLYAVAHNNLRTALRLRRLRRTVSLDRLLERAGEVFPALRRPDVAVAADERDAIQVALDRLSPALREALLLSTLWGFPSAEVGRILGITPAAARQRICRAKEAFDKHY